MTEASSGFVPGLRGRCRLQIEAPGLEFLQRKSLPAWGRPPRLESGLCGLCFWIWRGRVAWRERAEEKRAPVSFSLSLCQTEGFLKAAALLPFYWKLIGSCPHGLSPHWLVWFPLQWLAGQWVQLLMIQDINEFKYHFISSDWCWKYIFFWAHNKSHFKLKSQIF